MLDHKLLCGVIGQMRSGAFKVLRPYTYVEEFWVKTVNLGNTGESKKRVYNGERKG